MNGRRFLSIVILLAFLGYFTLAPLAYLPTGLSQPAETFREGLRISYETIVPWAGRENKTQAPEPFRIPVRTLGLDRRDIKITFEKYGTFSPTKQIRISTQEPGKVKRLLVNHVGTRVDKGETLAVLRRSKQAIQQARAVYTRRLEQLRFVQEKYWNKLQLHQVDAITDQELMNAAQSRFEAASKLLTAKIKLDSLEDNVIHAPVDGVIASRNVSEGDVVKPAGDPLMTMVTTDAVYFQVQIPETQVDKVRRDQVVTVNPAAYPSLRIQSKVLSVSPTIDPRNRSAIVQMLLDDRGEKLKPGMTGEAQFVVETRRNVLALPREAVVYTPGKEDRARVFIVRQGVALSQSVKLGGGNENLVHVLEGLSPGDRVVLNGQDRLKDLVKVDPEQVSYSSIVK